MRAVLPTLILGLLSSGCSGQSARWDAIDWSVERATAGAYNGTLHFEAKAKAGPVVLGSDSCDRFAWLWLSAEDTATGSLWCDFGGDIGVLTVALDGEAVSLPLIGGTLNADLNGEPFQTDWSGGFTAEDAFFGETSGTTKANGVTVVFDGWFEVSRVANAATP